MNNIVTVVLDNPTYATAPQIYQYNYGQILRIQGGAFPKAVEVHFSIQEKSGDSITRIGTTADGVTEVPIPELMLENYDSIENYDFWAYIYVEDGTSGTTECKIRIPVKARSKPEVPGTPEEPELFRETVKAVNDAADRAEQAEQNAKASATEAGKYAASASESVVAALKTKEDALREIGEKKQEAIEAIQKQEETSVGKIINHTDDEIKRILNQTAGSKAGLEQTITHADASKEELEYSIETAGTSKTALDKSVELAGTAKTELDTSTQKAGEAKTALDGSAKTAGEMQETLSATAKQAGALDTSLGEKIKTGTQLETDITASGEKAVQDIQNAGSEQLGKMQTVAEEFTADREQITTNKEDISSLKEELSKNYLDDAKTKRSLDALWKLNQGISYQFETDAEKAYQKDIPSGAKLVSVKKIGGRTVVWNQMLKLLDSSNWTARGTGGSIEIADGECIVRDCTSTWGGAVIAENLKILQTHKYYISLYGRVLNNGDSITIAVAETFPVTEIGVINSTTEYRVSKIVETSESLEGKFAFGNRKNTYDYAVSNFMLIDLTKMFGAGNEPSTPEEFEALFPEDYYPYNEGTLMSMPVNEVDIENANLIKPSTNFIDKSGYASKGVEYTYDADKVITINGTFKEDIVGGLFGIINYKNLSRYGDYTISVFDENNMLASDVKLNTGKNEQTFNYNANNGEIIITLVPTNGKTYINKKYYLQLIRGKQKKTYSPYRKKTYPIPQAILNLDGYGDGVSDDVYNYVDWENKEYHKRVGKVDLGKTTAFYDESLKRYKIIISNKRIPTDMSSITDGLLCTILTPDDSPVTMRGVDNTITGYQGVKDIYINCFSYISEDAFAKAMSGVMLYYELAEEEIIDISDIIDATFQEPIEVEAGGTLTFQNSNGDGYRLQVPNEEEYIVSLAEVGGGGASDE